MHPVNRVAAPVEIKTCENYQLEMSLCEFRLVAVQAVGEIILLTPRLVKYAFFILSFPWLRLSG